MYGDDCVKVKRVKKAKFPKTGTSKNGASRAGSPAVEKDNHIKRNGFERSLRGRPLMTSTPDPPLAVFTLPILSQPSIPPSLSYDPHRDAHTPLVIDNGSTSLKFGFATSTKPQVASNIVSKYKERKAGKQLLLFGDAVDAEGGARSQAKTPWEGDVLLNFDALVSPARIKRNLMSPYLYTMSRSMRWTTPLFVSASTRQPLTIPSS
jgi:hypothetical protein